jgi:hypothetical protein
MADRLVVARSTAEDAQAIIDAARAAFPLVVEEGAIHHRWAGALFCRTLDGYEAVLCLCEAGLVTEAWAHSRIAFEHLLGFAWVVARPSDAKRPLRIVRHGEGLIERRRAEMSRYAALPGPEAPVTAADVEPLDPPPPLPGLCHELDRELAPRIRKFKPGTAASFSGWYSNFYRRGSELVHPGPAGLEHLIEEVPDGLQVAPAKEAPEEVLGLALAQLTAAERIARVQAPWLLDGAGA